jgi:two-component system, NtrC family, response regulator GlrR
MSSETKTRSERAHPDSVGASTLIPYARRSRSNLECDVYTESLTSDPNEHALIRSFRLLVMSGTDANGVYRSTGERAVIGTHASADFVLRDRTASRFHCEIAVVDGRAVVRDLGSLNGTRINHVPVVQAYLRSGTLLSLGRTQIRFDFGHAKVKIPLSSDQRFGLMVGRSSAMRAVFAILQRAAQSDATVLLEGETGTGKEIAAESIHRESARRDGPFLVVDCGAISPDLIESELFGHERGAFTGAVSARRGAFEAASGGTLFLDEVGELRADLQPRLLRALERREIKRIGSNDYVPVDVRVVVASNRSLKSEVNAGRFRSDLYYRIAVIPVRLPPLRERPEDLPLLVEHLLSHLGMDDRPEAAALRSDAFLAELERNPFPGNVREVRNYLERCLVLREQVFRAPEQAQGLLDVIDTRMPFKIARDRCLRSFERGYLEDILRRHKDNASAAARAAGLDRMYFYRLLWRNSLR